MNTKENAFDLNVRELMKTRAGKEVVWEILDRCIIYDNPTGSSEAQTNQNIGRQDIGKQILLMLEEADPTIYPKLLLERIDYADTSN